MSRELFAVIDHASVVSGVKSIEIHGCAVSVEWQMSSLQQRGQWQLEVRPPNNGAAQYNLACDAGAYLIAVGACDPINLAQQVGPAETRQREIAARVLHNLMRYGMTEIGIVKAEQEVACIPIVGERDEAPFEDTRDLQIDPPRRFRVFHYAPYARAGEREASIESTTPEPVQWRS